MSDHDVRGSGRNGTRPEFAVTWRGYDRRQVDHFADRQLALLHEARRALQDARGPAASEGPAVRGLEAARVRALTGTPRSFEDLGEQIGRILREAWTVADEIRAEAERDAAEILRVARAEARGFADADPERD
jgi:cell division septum initiation protein DivIVA